MIKKRKNFLMLAIIGGIIMTIVGILFFTSLPWTIIYVGGMLSEDPPQPEITYGEFPFELVYEVDGEIKIVKDVVVIEYAGIGWNEGQGKYLIWDSHLKNAKTTDYYKGLLNGVLIFQDSRVAIYCHWGAEAYYLGKDGVVEPNASLFGIEKDGNLLTYEIDEIIEEHNIKVLDYKFSKPIKNTFK